ncbi:MAG: AMP-binding protein [Candidatus Binatus sp.]|uniref:class I adenylate-forming enzyme family protein n=1 Tax=Candidatus Binatus sp. TaxID=2811406 RepID=UPI0027231DCF|nr:AMP-binding protein [Candidatus Binatus sp.]MDO8433029.1 AMP-binding protein [Candidatus Binatus sp.]
MNTVNFVTIPSSIVPDQEILVFGNRRLTYAELNDRVSRLCAVFKQLGLQPRDVLAVLDTNSDLYIQCYYAAAKAGLTFLPLNYRAKDAELEYMINTANTRLLLVGDRYAELIDRIRPRLKVAQIVALGNEASGMRHVEPLLAKAEPDDAEAEVEDEDISILMYTSGTTSLPKGVMLRFRDFAAYVTANVEMADGTDRGVALVCVPFYHIAGTTAYMTNIWTGRKLIVMSQFDPKSWLEIVQRERVTHAFVVPTMMKQLIDEPGFASTDFSSLTNLAYGGAPMPVQVIRRAIEVFPPKVGFVNAYGQTETTSSLTILGPDDHRLAGTAAEIELKLKRLNSIGKPLPDVEIKVRDDDGKFLSAGEVGEIIIRTPRIMKGYAGRDDDARLPDGWRATGDLGWLDDEGYVFFAGRKDDMIIRGGENIAPAEIETVLMSHPAVDECAVIGVPSVEWGQTVKAFVVPHKSPPVTEADLAEFCRSRLASFKRPETIEFIEALPKNPLGKILRKDLRAPGGAV